MVSLISKGFTLLEILVALGIVAVIAAITFPIWGAAKQNARMAETVENLHQAWLALELYRQDHDGGSLAAGTSSQLGLPNRDGFFALLDRSGIRWWYSPGRFGYGPVYYPMDRSDFIVPELKDANQRSLDHWLVYNGTAGFSSVIVGDFQHTVGCGRYPVRTCQFKGFGERLDGSLAKRLAVGEIHEPSWWESK